MAVCYRGITAQSCELTQRSLLVLFGSIMYSFLQHCTLVLLIGKLYSLLVFLRASTFWWNLIQNGNFIIAISNAFLNFHQCLCSICSIWRIGWIFHGLPLVTKVSTVLYSSIYQKKLFNFQFYHCTPKCSIVLLKLYCRTLIR